jgi:hypothetical protein
VDGTAARPIVIRAAPGERVVLRGRLKIQADHVRVSGLIMRGPGPSQGGDVLLYVSRARDVIVSQNRFTDAAKSAIFVGDGSADVRLIGNLILHNGTNPKLDHGVYFGDVTGGLIADNVMARNAAYGIQLYPHATAIVVTQNTIVDNGLSGVMIGGERTTTSEGNTVVNNIIAFNGEDGVRTYWGGPVGVGNQVLDNLVYGNAVGGVVGLAASGTVVLDPGFVDRPNDDYRLRSSSPAIERAALKYTTKTDLLGRPRPLDRLPSLGAYELGSD